MNRPRSAQTVCHPPGRCLPIGTYQRIGGLETPLPEQDFVQASVRALLIYCNASAATIRPICCSASYQAAASRSNCTVAGVVARG